MAELRRILRRDGLDERTSAEAFGHIAAAMERAHGRRCSPVHRWAAAAMLKEQIAELPGDDDRFAALGLAACAAALVGVPVHVMAASEAAAVALAAFLDPVGRSLGLSVGLVRPEADEAERRTAYRCDVTCGSARQLAFDSLRDTVAMGSRAGRLKIALSGLGADSGEPDLMLRGLPLVLLDEADEVLIVQARLPLILSRPGRGGQARLNTQALRIAEQLAAEHDFAIDAEGREAALTGAGRLKVGQLAQPLGGFWNAVQRREMVVEQALTALHGLRRGIEYSLDDGVVQYAAEGIRAEGSPEWHRGLVDLIRLKEGCAPADERDPLARTSLHAVVGRYVRRGGCAVSVTGLSRALDRLYGLRCVRPAGATPRESALLVRACSEDKWRALAVHLTGASLAQPVVVFVESDAAEQEAQACCSAAGLIPVTAREPAPEHSPPAAVTIVRTSEWQTIRSWADARSRQGHHLRMVLGEPFANRALEDRLVALSTSLPRPAACLRGVSWDDRAVAETVPALAACLRRAPISRLNGRVAEWVLACGRRLSTRRQIDKLERSVAAERMAARLMSYAGRPS